MRLEPFPHLRLLVGGEWIGATGESMDVYDPASGEALGSLPVANEALLGEAVTAASSAFASWRATSAKERGAILGTAARMLRERAEEIAVNLVRENGKPLAEARLEVAGSADILEWFAEEARRAYGRVIPPRTSGSRLLTQREPVGVVALFMAWNYPATNFVRKVAPALAAGCSIVAKPSEETPATALAIAQCLIDAGLPASVLNVVFGDPPRISNYLIRDPAVRKVSFTGSTRVGRELARLAGENLKRTTMELGGHAPLIICDDVDVRRVAAMAAAFKFRNAGQICTSPSRFYVQERIFPEFLACFTEIAAALRVGPGLAPDTTMGPLTHRGRQETMEKLVANAISHGARVRCGADKGSEKGYFYKPTILTELGRDSAILRDEPFGPVVPLISFASLDEAIAGANDTPYGLAAYAFTRSLSNACRLADSLEAGQVCINNFVPSLPETPAGGFKDSGWGYENGIEGLEPYLQTKFVHEALMTE